MSDNIQREQSRREENKIKSDNFTKAYVKSPILQCQISIMNNLMAPYFLHFEAPMIF